MRTVGSYQAKSHLPRLLRHVGAGERITITRHGVPVAILAPPDSKSTPRRKAGRSGSQPRGDAAAELRWLARHGDKYAGQWVALDGNRLIAHGTNARQIHEAARRRKGKLPLVVQVEPAPKLPFGGW